MIKKLLISLFCIFLFVNGVFAKEFMPQYSNNFKYFGIGLYFGTGQTTIYSLPDEKSPVLANLKWDDTFVYNNGKEIDPINIFAVFIPKKGLSGFIAIDETGGKYTQIVYDLNNNKTGWIKNAENSKAFYWRQLFYRYGKTTGLYFLKDIPKEKRILRLAPEDYSEISYQFVSPKYVRLQLIKGNWALLKVVDYDNEQKIGWFQWRNENGTLNMMPDFAK